ncbi:MAG TPA: terminase family protein, partial [Haloferula sp.]
MKAAKDNKKAAQSLVKLRSYQLPIFRDRKTGVLLLHWSRQIGKSHTLAAWAVDRLLENPGRLVTVLSNTRDNGAEFVQKAAEFARLLGVACETEDQSPDVQYQNMRMEVRITIGGRTGRIKVLAANPRTARGFSGDLILDEFAFHEDSVAIWDAAEPIISSNPDFLCRIASTGNGKHNMFYRFTAGAKPIEGEPNMYITDMGFKLSRMPRTEAYRQGVKVYDPTTRQPITPDQARAKSADKRSYDQNYECIFTDENSVLLTHELISAAEAEDIGEICDQDWSGAALERIRKASGPIVLGVDVGRQRDLTVMTAVEIQGPLRLVRGILRIQGMRLPNQQVRLGEALKAAKVFQGACIDMTGLGIGLLEYAQDEFGARIQGINFATSVPTTARIKQEGRKAENVRVTEAMATELLQVYEDRLIKHPGHPEL